MNYSALSKVVRRVPPERCWRTALGFKQQTQLAVVINSITSLFAWREAKPRHTDRRRLDVSQALGNDPVGRRADVG